MDLTEAQWLAVEPYIPAAERRRPGKRGGRPFRPARDVLDAVLWVLRTGAPWADLPGRYPPYQTCHRRFQTWVQSGVLPKVLAALRRDLETRGGIENVEAFIDGTHIPAKKGGPASGGAVPAAHLAVVSPMSEALTSSHPNTEAAPEGTFMRRAVVRSATATVVVAAFVTAGRLNIVALSAVSPCVFFGHPKQSRSDPRTRSDAANVRGGAIQRIVNAMAGKTTHGRLTADQPDCDEKHLAALRRAGGLLASGRSAAGRGSRAASGAAR